MKRAFKLENLQTFQQHLESFFLKRVEQEALRSKELEPYKQLCYDYKKKGMTLRAISKATGIPHTTVYNWIKDIEKKLAPAQDTSPTPEAEAIAPNQS
jgi:transposase-like protein